MTSYNPLKKNTAQRIVFPLLDADGDPVGGVTNADSEYAVDGGTFSDCSDEVHNMTSGGSNTGIYYLDLTTGETNGDCICIQIKSTEAKTTVLVFYTQSTNVDAVGTNVSALMADVGDASGSTLGSLYAIVGNPAATLNSKIDVIDDYIDTEIGDIHTDVADIHADLVHIHDTDLPAVKTDTGLIKVATDKLQFSVANDVKATLDSETVTAASVTDKTGYSISGAKTTLDALNDIAAASVWAVPMEGALTAKQQMNLQTAALAGKSSGGGTNTIVFQDQADTKPRITATVDADGNRTAITNDGA